MIQLATDPNASRLQWRPAAAADGRAPAPKGRSGHAWPFISRPAERPTAHPAPQSAARTPSSQGS